MNSGVQSVLVKETFRPADLVERIRRLVHSEPAVSQRDGSSIVIKVLYVEDNDDNVYMLKMRLELLGDSRFWRRRTARRAARWPPASGRTSS